MSQKSVSGWFKSLSFKKAKKDKGEEKETGKETDKNKSKKIVGSKTADALLKEAIVLKVSEITGSKISKDTFLIIFSTNSFCFAEVVIHLKNPN